MKSTKRRKQNGGKGKSEKVGISPITEHPLSLAPHARLVRVSWDVEQIRISCDDDDDDEEEDDGDGDGDDGDGDGDDDKDGDIDEDGFLWNWWICDGCASFSSCAPAPDFDDDCHDDDNDDSMNGEYVDDNILWFH